MRTPADGLYSALALAFFLSGCSPSNGLPTAALGSAQDKMPFSERDCSKPVTGGTRLGSFEAAFTGRFIIGNPSTFPLELTSEDRSGRRFSGPLKAPILVTLEDRLGHVRLSCNAIWDTTVTPHVSWDGHGDNFKIRIRFKSRIQVLALWTNLPKDIGLSTASLQIVPAWLRLGSDGNLWGPLRLFTGVDVARIALNGETTIFSDPDPTRSAPLLQTVRGPDGNVWIPYASQYGPGGMDRVAPDGTFTAFPFPSAAYEVNAMVAGKSDDLVLALTWYKGGEIASFGMNGALKILATAPSNITNLTWGSDGNLWFLLKPVTAPYGRHVYVGTLTATGLKTYALCCFNQYNGYFSFAVGPDGKFWAPYPYGSKTLLKFTTSGQITDRIDIPYPAAAWSPVLKGPNIVDYAIDGKGELYAADEGADGSEHGGSGLIAFTKRGTVNEYPTYVLGIDEPTSVVFDALADRLYLANTYRAAHRAGGSIIAVDPKEL
ncbi:MAG TPA: hypothetical protein VGG89_12220 [Candidatus Baltobacteraceae bacterium]|jgi:hypothetical protein